MININTNNNMTARSLRVSYFHSFSTKLFCLLINQCFRAVDMTQSLNLPVLSSVGPVCKSWSVLHSHPPVTPGSLEDGMAGSPGQHLGYVSAPASPGINPHILAPEYCPPSRPFDTVVKLSETKSHVFSIGSSFIQSLSLSEPFVLCTWAPHCPQALGKCVSLFSSSHPFW